MYRSTFIIWHSKGKLFRFYHRRDRIVKCGKKTKQQNEPMVSSHLHSLYQFLNFFAVCIYGGQMILYFLWVICVLIWLKILHERLVLLAHPHVVRSMDWVRSLTSVMDVCHHGLLLSFRSRNGRIKHLHLWTIILLVFWNDGLRLLIRLRHGIKSKMTSLTVLRQRVLRSVILADARAGRGHEPHLLSVWDGRHAFRGLGHDVDVDVPLATLHLMVLWRLRRVMLRWRRHHGTWLGEPELFLEILRRV